LVKRHSVVVDARLLASADDIAGVREQLDEICDKLARLVDILTVKHAKTRRTRTAAQQAAHAFRMRQSRAAKAIGLSLLEFRERFGDVDHIPIDAPRNDPRMNIVRKKEKQCHDA
jgi:hypothetical protein